jgi:hypothetical protein
MTVKVMMTWDILPEHEQDYFDFVIGEFIPGVQRLGFQPVEAWVTAYGNYPQIQIGILGEDVRGVQQILHSEGWKKLQDKLFALVKNFSYKVIPARNGFQF